MKGEIKMEDAIFEFYKNKEDLQKCSKIGKAFRCIFGIILYVAILTMELSKNKTWRFIGCDVLVICILIIFWFWLKPVHQDPEEVMNVN